MKDELRRLARLLTDAAGALEALALASPDLRAEPDPATEARDAPGAPEGMTSRQVQDLVHQITQQEGEPPMTLRRQGDPADLDGMLLRWAWASGRALAVRVREREDGTRRAVVELDAPGREGTCLAAGRIVRLSEAGARILGLARADTPEAEGEVLRSYGARGEPERKPWGTRCGSLETVRVAEHLVEVWRHAQDDPVPEATGSEQDARPAGMTSRRVQEIVRGISEQEGVPALLLHRQGDPDGPGGMILRWAWPSGRAYAVRVRTAPGGPPRLAQAELDELPWGEAAAQGARRVAELAELGAEIEGWVLARTDGEVQEILRSRGAEGYMVPRPYGIRWGRLEAVRVSPELVEVWRHPEPAPGEEPSMEDVLGDRLPTPEELASRAQVEQEPAGDARPHDARRYGELLDALRGQDLEPKRQRKAKSYQPCLRCGEPVREGDQYVQRPGSTRRRAHLRCVLEDLAPTSEGAVPPVVEAEAASAQDLLDEIPGEEW